MNFVPELGKIIAPETDARRDAIHVAVAPVVAGMLLPPGSHVWLKNGVAYLWDGENEVVGVVDPYLKRDVEKGERFWLCLLPNTVTSLRHVWTHPAFSAQAPVVKEASNAE